MFGGFGIEKIFLLMIVVLLLFGAKRLPEIGSSIGRGIREFKRSVNDLQNEVHASDTDAAPASAAGPLDQPPAPPRPDDTRARAQTTADVVALRRPARGRSCPPAAAAGAGADTGKHPASPRSALGSACPASTRRRANRACAARKSSRSVPGGTRNERNSSGNTSFSPTKNAGSAPSSSSSKLSGLRHRAEPAIRQQRELIVVVADHAAVTCHAEILEQHVAGEDVGAGEILDRLAIVERGVQRRGRRRVSGDTD